MNNLLNDVVLHHRHNLPRKRARYDNFKSRHRRTPYTEKTEFLKKGNLSPRHH